MGKSTIYDDLFIKIWTFYQKKCWKHDLLGEPPPKSSLVHVLMGRSSKYTYNSYTEIRHVMVIQHIYIYMESGYTKSRIYILYLHNVAYHIIWYLYHNHITYNTPLNNHLIYIYTVTCHIITIIYDGFNIFSNNKENTLYHDIHQTYVILYHIYIHRKYILYHITHIYIYTLWLFDIAMENHHFWWENSL